jgi:hypothetical protein
VPSEAEAAAIPSDVEADAAPPPSYKNARRRGMQNISRVESGSTRGWTVRFQRGGQKHGRFFYDKHYKDGAEGALRAARRWRNAKRKELGPVQKSDASRMHTPYARQKNRQSVSRTGVTGIGVQVREFAAQRVPYVTAYWIDEGGRRRMTSFSTAEHGVDGALRLAARARAQTAEWHGATPMTKREIYSAAADRVRELAEPPAVEPAE